MVNLVDFNTVLLEDLAGNHLQNRIDNKYVIHESMLPDLLNGMKLQYDCLEINGLRSSNYTTWYYDTDNLKCYHDTRLGKPRRYKFRFRKYHNGDLCFFEIKNKIKGIRTLKERIPVSEMDILAPDVQAFLLSRNVDPTTLNASLKISYDRICLISNQNEDRVTVDTNIIIYQDNKTIALKGVAVIEVKHKNIKDKTDFAEMLRGHRIKKSKFSKYCIGLGLTKKGINLAGISKKVAWLKEITHTLN